MGFIYAILTLEISLFSQENVSFIFASAMIIGTLVTAIDRIPYYDPLTCELATAVPAVWRQRAHRAFKTIKHMSFTAQPDFKALPLVIPAYFTTDMFAFISTHKVLLYLIWLMANRGAPVAPRRTSTKDYLLLLLAACAFLIFWLRAFV